MPKELIGLYIPYALYTLYPLYIYIYIIIIIIIITHNAPSVFKSRYNRRFGWARFSFLSAQSCPFRPLLVQNGQNGQ